MPCMFSLASCPSAYTVLLCSPVRQHWILLLSTCLWSTSCLDFIMMIWRLHLNLYHCLVTAVCLNLVIVRGSVVCVLYLCVCTCVCMLICMYMHTGMALHVSTFNAITAFSVESELKSHLLTTLNGSSTEEL